MTAYCIYNEDQCTQIYFESFLGYCLSLERKGSYVDSYSGRLYVQGCHNTSYQSIRIVEGKLSNFRMLHSF